MKRRIAIYFIACISTAILSYVYLQNLEDEISEFAFFLGPSIGIYLGMTRGMLGYFLSGVTVSILVFVVGEIGVRNNGLKSFTFIAISIALWLMSGSLIVSLSYYG